MRAFLIGLVALLVDLANAHAPLRRLPAVRRAPVAFAEPVAAFRTSCAAFADRASAAGFNRTAYLDAHPAAKTCVLLAIGAMSGAVTKTVLAPLERVKLLAQAGAVTGAAARPLNIVASIVEKEGIVGLWRGNTANVLRIIPNKGVLLMCSDQYKVGIRSLCAAAGINTQSAVVAFAAGSLAGMTAVSATYPLDVIRTRMAYKTVSATSSIKRSVRGAASKIVADEGVGGLYKGIKPTLFGALPYEGLKFGCYEYFKSKLPQDKDGNVHPRHMMLAGAGAATVAHLVTYPVDTVRRRMQLDGLGGAVRLYTGALNCAQTVAATEGVGALYRGIGVTVLRGVPNNAIQLVSYELAKRVLKVNAG